MMYKLNPKGYVSFKGRQVPVILCHQDSYRLGLGSNHADVLHWFSRYGKTMDNVREDVYKLMTNSSDTITPTPSQDNTPSTPYLVYTRVLRRGREGDDVKALQKALIDLGYNCGSYGADGDFGRDTEKAVTQFQRDNGLDDDGEAGQTTIAKINELLGKKDNKQDQSNKDDQTTPVIVPPSTTTTIYRVRKSWDDPSSQAGAFGSLANAKRMCDAKGKGYYVFDDAGNVVYAANSTPSDSSQDDVTPAHTYSGVMLGYAAKDERGAYVGGQAGDQTGKEVYINGWYDQSWTSVLRPKSAVLAERIARQCENACNNNKIGYSQSDRNTLLKEVKKVGYDMSKVTTPCNCDCSSFVSAVCVCCGLPESTFFPGGNGCVTSTIGPACLSTGQFVELTDMKYRNQKYYLKRGDILLNRNAHVVIVLSDGSKA